MNWIILIIAGLCETGFAFCLGKGNLATGNKELCGTQFSVYHNAIDNYLQHSEIGDKYTEPQHIVEDDADVVKLYIRKTRESFRTRTIESTVLHS